MLIRDSVIHVWCLVAQSCWLFVTPWSVAHQAPLSMGILQARILEWVAMPSSRGFSQPRDWTRVFHTTGRFFTVWATIEAHTDIRLAKIFFRSFCNMGKLKHFCQPNIYIYTLFHILFHYGLSQDIEYSSLCHTVGPWFLSILYVFICIC